MHIVPLQSVTSDTQINISLALQSLRKLQPPGASGWSHRLNLDGSVTFSETGKGYADGYALTFRSGIIEAVQVWETFNGEVTFPSHAYEDQMRLAVGAYFRLLNDIGISAPAYLFLALTKMAGYKFAVDRNRFMGSYHSVDRDTLVMPEVLVEDWSVDPAKTMRPLFDMVWNAFGYERSFNYDEQGCWAPR